MNSKKIVILTNNTRPNSGWGRYSSEIIDQLKSPELSIIVLSEKSDSEPRYTYEHQILLPQNSAISFLNNVKNIKKYSRGADIIHAFDGWPYSVYAFLALVGTKKKLLINAVGTYSIVPRFSPKGLLMKLAYKSAKQIFAISNYTARKVKEAVPMAKVDVVHLGLTKVPKLSEEEISMFKEKFGTIKAYPSVLTVGSVKPRKGQLDTLKAIHILKNEFPQIKYRIVGRIEVEDYANQIRRYAEENSLDVDLITSASSEKELSFFYRTSDIFALNSRNDGDHFEGFGLVLIEAASAGLPVVGSKDCGIEDAIEAGFNGYHTEQGNPEDIADKIKRVLEEKEILVKNAVEFSKRFDWEETASSYKEHYLGLV